ncbi:MAG: CRISPR system precrRNA processing endoribonuclease RAMP protein Cas6 [Ardenticatenaceae bacterium]|nr:CRISPR system precrRNA processing endoribonuclease RAMP protein Cas6 [Ardenticatenaceae bacterium]
MSDPTLFALVLHLHPLAPARLPATMGHQAHAAFLAAVRGADPALAERLHAPEAVKPFTVSPLFGLPRARDGLVAMSPERTYRLRLTLLDSILYQELMGRFLTGDQRLIRLGSVDFAINKVCATPQGDSEAGATSAAQLWESARPPRSLALRFRTLTAFNRTQGRDRRFLLFPEPPAVFDSLLRVWNTLDGPQFEKAPLREYVAAHVVVAEYALRTRMWQYRHSRQVGFVGTVRYECRGYPEASRRQLAALSALSFYSGVGYKTTQGMGQVRPVPDEG